MSLWGQVTHAKTQIFILNDSKRWELILPLAPFSLNISKHQ
jgi:hypothetical protein